MCIILLKYLKFENEHEKMDYFLVYSAALIFHLAFHPVQPAVQRRRSKNTSANTRKVARRSTTVATLDNDAPAEDTTIDPIILADPLLRKDFKFKRGYYFIHNINPKPIYVSEIIHTISQFDEKQGRTSETFDTPHFNISIPANGTSRKLDFDYQSLRSGSDRWTATVEYDNPELNAKQYCRAPRVAILVSSEIEQFLQLYWDVEYVNAGDWVGLFKKDPQGNNETFPIYTVKVQNTTGFSPTNITLDRKSSERDVKFVSECLGFWIAYFTDDGTAAAVSCLKTNPTWMYDMRQHLENVPIKQLFIPGTHDSGSYITLEMLSTMNVVDRYVFTQDEDIINQLVYGIRYLDLRVSSNPLLEERWWLNHGVVRVQPLHVILDDVKLFLRSTREIVILDFHGFPVGFAESSKTHRDFVDYIESELSEWIAPPDWSSTCGHLWNLNKTLIVSYNNDVIVKEYPSLLWSAVVHKWANVQNIDQLKDYFSKVIENRPSYSWAAMAEFTPTLWTILTYQTIGLREMAANVNVNVTNWFRGVWGKTCNIVAVDFFRGTDIVEAAIEWNVRRSTKHICDIR